MASLLYRFEHGRAVVTTVVIVAAGPPLTVTCVVLSHPTESTKEPGIVLTATSRVTSSQSSVTVMQRSTTDGGASSAQHGSDGFAVDSRTSLSSLTQSRVSQTVEPDPPVAADYGHCQPAPVAPAVPVGTVAPAAPGHTEVDDDDDDKRPARNGMKEPDDDGRDTDS